MPKEIKLYGEIGLWGDVSHRYLARELEGCEGQAITIRVHSPGGSVFEGWAMFNLLQTCAQKGAKITFYVDGIAASMMSFLIQAGHKIYAAENSLIMIHAPSGYAKGKWENMQEAATLLKKIGLMMQKEYQRRSNRKQEEVEKWMRGENWFTPEEALAAGLIDGIVPPVATRKMESKEMSPNQAYEAYSAFMIPESININTRMKEVTAFLGMGDEAQGPEVLAKIKSLLGNEKARADAAEQSLETLKASLAKEKAIALIEGATQAGKISPGDAAKYQKLAEADYETTKALIDTMNPLVSVMGQIQTGSAKSKSEKAAEFDKHHKDGTLEELKATNLERYNELYAARYQ